MKRAKAIEEAAQALLSACTAPDLGGAGYCSYLPGELDAIISLRAAFAMPLDELVTCDMYRHGCMLGLHHVRQHDCVNPVVVE